MIGNFDWCLKFSPDDIYRCNEPRPLWNVVAFDMGGSKASLLMKDFDLAGMVVGKHSWFDKVWNRKFVQSGSETEIEVLSQVQRTRSLFPRAQLDAERRHFIGRKAALYEAVQTRRGWTTRDAQSPHDTWTPSSRRSRTMRRSTGPSWRERTCRSSWTPKARARRANRRM